MYENLMKRIRQRGWTEERNISLQFLQQLHRLHEKYIQDMEETCQILTVNADTKLKQETLTQILCFLKKAGGVGSQ